MITNYKSKRNDFRKLFKNISGEQSILVADYSCALYTGTPKILQQGRMYITTENICFYCKIISETKIIIDLLEIQDITKEKIALLIPNSIQIVCKNQNKYFFASFTNRDKTYQLIEKLWIEVSNEQKILPEILWDRIREGYGNELGFSVDDPEYEESKASQFIAVFKNIRRCSEVLNGSSIPSSQESSYESFEELASVTDLSSDASSLSSKGEKGKRLSKKLFKSSLNKKSKTSEDNSEIQFNLYYRNTSRSNNNSEKKLSETLSSIQETPENKLLARAPAQCLYHEHFPNVSIDEEFDLNVNTIWKLVFNDNPFYRALCAMRSITDITVSPWPARESNKENYRTIYYVTNLKNRIGPKKTATEEKQVLLKESEDDYKYITESNVRASGVPLSDSFHVIVRYCLLYVNPHRTRVKSSFKIVYDKYVMFPAKSIIELSTRNGCIEFCRDMRIALHEEIAKQTYSTNNENREQSNHIEHNINRHVSTIEEKYQESIEDIDISSNTITSNFNINHSTTTSWIIMVIICSMFLLLMYMLKELYITKLDEPTSTFNKPLTTPPTEDKTNLEDLVKIVSELKSTIESLRVKMEQLSQSCLLYSNSTIPL